MNKIKCVLHQLPVMGCAVDDFYISNPAQSDDNNYRRPQLQLLYRHIS